MDGAGEFMDGTSSTDENPCYKWQDTGCHVVQLVATNEIGCTDTTEQVVCSTFVAIFIPYNVFTPEPKDGLNDVFRVRAQGLVKFDIVIYNRWGEVVFESKDDKFQWNGKVKNTGAECPEGTYFYLINYQIQDEKLNDGKNGGKPVSGTVTLIRGK
jgi:gliding motility-associated-like protein